MKEVINGVANVLKPILMENAERQAKLVFEAQSKALIASIKLELDNASKKQPDGQLPANTGKEDEEATQEGEGNKDNTNPQSGGLGGLAPLAMYIVEHAEDVKGLIDAFRGTPSADVQIGNQIGTIFKWHKALSAIEKSGGNADEIAGAINQVFGSPQK